MLPLISIITPNYNKAAYISETIESVISQTYPHWEHIIIDDGSTDDSIEIIDKYLQKNNRIKLIERTGTKKGGSVCRNIGLKASKGKYIIFLDSDDLLAPKALENRLDNITKSNFNVVVFPMGTFYNKPGDNNSTWLPPKNNHLKKFLSHDLPWSIMQPIWEKEFLLKTGGFDENFPRLQDVELHTRALLQPDVKYKIAETKTPDCYYRIDNNRIVSNYYNFIIKWAEGSILYVEKMYVKIAETGKNATARHKALRGTVITIINHILHNSATGNISKEQAGGLISKLLTNKTVKKLGYTKMLDIYIKLYKAGMYRLKGFNFIYKYLYINL